MEGVDVEDSIPEMRITRHAFRFLRRRNGYADDFAEALKFLSEQKQIWLSCTVLSSGSHEICVSRSANGVPQSLFSHGVGDIPDVERP